MRISDWSSDVCSSDLRLGRLLFEGTVFRQDRTRGRQLLEKAAAAGNPYAQTYLADLYALGTILKPDPGQAFALAQAAAKAGLAEGVNELAVLYWSGTGTAKKIFGVRSEEHTSELQSLMRISYAVFCLKKKKDKR